MPRRLALTRGALQRYSKMDIHLQKQINDGIATFAAGRGRVPVAVPRAIDSRIRLLRLAPAIDGVLLTAEADLFLLLDLLPLEAAHRFATSRRATVNMVTGVLEVRHETALEQFSASLRTEAEKTRARLFTGIAEDELARLGVDFEVRELIRLVATFEHLAALQPWIPEMQYEALRALAVGASFTQAQATVEAYVTDSMDEPVDPQDLASAMRRTPANVVIVEDSDEWRKIFDSPFDEWRFFLHPAQISLAQSRYAGPALVTGGPGTGKTVSLMHRAHQLARLCDGQASTQVLITTYTRNLARALRDQLKLLIDDDETFSRIGVSTVDALAYDIVQKGWGRRPRLIDEPTLLGYWRREIRAVQAPFKARFLNEEWFRVILPGKIASLDQYLACDREASGRHLSPGQQTLIWEIVRRVTEQLTRRNEWTYPQLCDHAADQLALRAAPPYRHLLIDEAQDLHPAHWRLLRASVAEGSDDMFIVGDPHQRIYDYRLSLPAHGIDLGDRHHKLHLSYRTTQQILTWATPKLGETSILGLNGQADDLMGFQSPTNGIRPIVRDYDYQDQELDGLVEQIRQWQANGVELPAIGVASRSNEMISEAKRVLDAAGIDHVDLESERDVPALRIGTMHGMKGREFRCVAVIGVRAGRVPLADAVTPASDDPLVHERDMQKERCLLFVACTRARDVLYLSYSGAASPFLLES